MLSEKDIYTRANEQLDAYFAATKAVDPHWIPEALPNTFRVGRPMALITPSSFPSNPRNLATPKLTPNQRRAFHVKIYQFAILIDDAFRSESDIDGQCGISSTLSAIPQVKRTLLKSGVVKRLVQLLIDSIPLAQSYPYLGLNYWDPPKPSVSR